MENSIDPARLLSFLGFGNPAAEAVFIGMEEGLTVPPPLDEQLLARSAYTPMIDLAESAKANPEWFLSGDRPPIQPTWNTIIRILLALEGLRAASTDQVRAYQRDRLGRKREQGALLELLPLPAPGISDWPYAEISPSFRPATVTATIRYPSASPCSPSTSAMVRESSSRTDRSIGITTVDCFLAIMSGGVPTRSRLRKMKAPGSSNAPLHRASDEWATRCADRPRACKRGRLIMDELSSPFSPDRVAALRAHYSPTSFTKEALLKDEYLLASEERFRVYYAALGAFPSDQARIIFVGLTPGLSQMQEAARAFAETSPDVRNDLEAYSKNTPSSCRLRGNDAAESVHDARHDRFPRGFRNSSER